MARAKHLASLWDSANIWLKRLITLGASIATIFGVFAGALGWGIGKLDAHLDPKFQELTAQVNELRSGSDLADKELELSNTRLELTTLMAHSPTNVIEIEKVARYYFIDLGGDWYMSQIYSDWAREYGGDLTFVTDVR